ncbi:hypothetical protein BpHYR1_038565 [Brachionus plicatilis]|uniref:Uncharacterized protein n=1 Tax=Brachionus plicatilis TaxID=10195 RepID=A0A3M7PLS7_BRAPC|nr:hypothetical protein BpHYR1_038565 [Brachionus plicatilis]
MTFIFSNEYLCRLEQLREHATNLTTLNSIVMLRYMVLSLIVFIVKLYNGYDYIILRNLTSKNKSFIEKKNHFIETRFIEKHYRNLPN